ncbi:HTTM domain-containing protein [Halorussus aquaticus]|uniref:HTTM domain-containing protein n=1 Tax=Halorussus aquaticus TaxID=2953748 RepID=A0ABD5PZI1_9EURY|nr:HTTM domain-containing protein [Halorussus aquaticus]
MDVRALRRTLRDRAGSALARRFGVDPRALAALRVSLGVLLLTDLLLRSRDLVAFYTDAGVLPRSVLREHVGGIAALSLHALSGSAWVQGLLFVLAGAAAAALLVGYRTTLATAVSFVLLVSLHARNPVLLNGGDSLLRRLLFWGAFLPLGRRWSVDALRAERERECDPASDGTDRVANLASAALLVQVVLVYATNAVYKLRGDLWVSGEAILYVFRLDQLTTGLGEVLANYPTVLRAFDRVWLGLLVTSVGLLLLTGWTRAAFAALFAGMHLGMALTMRITVFPLISVAGLLPFLPGAFWDAATAKVRESRPGERFDAADWSRRVERLLPEARFGAVGAVRTVGAVPAGVARWARRIRPPVVGCLLALVLVWNAAALGYVALPEDVSSTVDPEEYRWDMFAPEPRTTDGWYVVPGELASGERVDVFHRRAVRWDPPPDVARSYRNVRWFKYMMDLRASAYAPLRPQFADYLCQRWNATHEDGVRRLELYYVEQPVRLDGPDPTRRVKLHSHTCSGPA